MRKKMEEVKKDSKGFTLIELLVVVAIIAILAAIAIPQYAKYKERAAKASAISDAKNIANALEAYYADNESYPASYSAFSSDIKLSPNNTVVNYSLIGKTGYQYSVSNTIYGKAVSYNSTAGGLIESTWK